MIMINDRKVTELAFEYGVERDGEITDHGDELSAAMDVAVFGGKIKFRRVYVSDWADSPRQPEQIPPDDLA
jgi:hypothetical protein